MVNGKINGADVHIGLVGDDGFIGVLVKFHPAGFGVAA
jgi:hypothetical protein